MEAVLYFVIMSSIAASVGIVIILLRAKKRLSAPTQPGGNDGAVTVSVCIPARNEAHALSACLDKVLASDYERLEVLVLDDESIDQTPTLIKSFAHAGVRFIAGKPLSNGWIGKNHALDTLLREASGDYILFLDVDVHVSRYTISAIVASMSADDTMVSFIPQRRDTTRASALFGHLRYLWDMIHVGFGGTSASASLWCVRREWLLDSRAGFEPIRDVVRPELVLAEKAGTSSRFYLGGDVYGIAYEKRWHSQVESSGRLIIPTIRQYGMRGLLAAILIGLWALMAPVALLLGVSEPAVAGVMILAVFVVGYIVHLNYLRMAWHTKAWLGSFLWWWAGLQELILIAVSLIQYSTGTVTWKGRSIRAAPKNDDYYSL